MICKDLTGEVLLKPLVLITLKPKLADDMSTPFNAPRASQKFAEGVDFIAIISKASTVKAASFCF